MTTKKAVKRDTRRAPRKPAKKATGEIVCELDGQTVTTFLGNLTAVIQRSNDVIAHLGRPTHTDAPSPGRAVEAAGCNTNQAAAVAQLPSLEILVDRLADKCRTLHGFSCHLRETVQECAPLQQAIAPRDAGLKGQLDEAFQLLDMAHDNLLHTRNVVTN
ncbi:MAG TPA: hypothetical protein VGU67_02815 [Edaphobacter sp.]|nr:hypothetical protein [Edaphobacter sp.]